MPEVWWRFRDAVEKAGTLDVARLVAGRLRAGLDDAVLAAYDAPFPDETYKAGPRAMPTLVPTPARRPGDRGQPRRVGGADPWDKPFLVAFSDGDPITGGDGAGAAASDAGRARARATRSIEGAGHFLQEDAGARLGEVVAQFVRGA